MKRRAIFFVLSLTVAGSTAHAEPSASAKASAEALFKQGRELMKNGNVAAACPKLAESQRLDPAAGTLLNLAECYEKNGQTASAWATFGEAARAAELRRRSDWKATAELRVKELEPALSYLVIEVDPTAPSDLTVTRDGEEVHRATWAAPIPVDPGAHTIAAAASGKIGWKTTIDVKKERDRVTVKVPALANKPAIAPPAAAPPPPPPIPPRSEFPKTAVGLGVAGLGVAGLAAGFVFGAMASSQASIVDKRCPGSPCSDHVGLDANDKAHTFATGSTIAVIAGGVLTAAGLAIWLWPSKGSSSVALSPGLVEGTF